MRFGILSLKAQKGGKNSSQMLPSDNTKYAYRIIISSRHFLRKGRWWSANQVFLRLKVLRGGQCNFFDSDTAGSGGEVWRPVIRVCLSVYLIQSVCGGNYAFVIGRNTFHVEKYITT